MGTLRTVKGFTLIELMIVVAVVAILAAIAYPAYQQHVFKTRRAAATGCAMEMAQFMERFHTTNLSYEGAAPAQADFECGQDLAEFYEIGLAADATANAFTISAEPIGGQAGDTKCGTLTLNQTGARTHDGSAANVADCW